MTCKHLNGHSSGVSDLLMCQHRELKSPSLARVKSEQLNVRVLEVVFTNKHDILCPNSESNMLPKNSVIAGVERLG